MLGNVNTGSKQNDKQLGIFHLNVQCLNNKTDMLSLYLRDAKFDILCFSEHWQDSSEIANQYIPGYILRASFCRDRLRHGGVAIYTGCGIVCDEISLEDLSVEFQAEFAGIALHGLNCAVIVVYRSDRHGDFAVFMEHLERLLERINTRYKYIFILGDLNCDPVKYPNENRVLKYTMDSYGLVNAITGYTRVTQKTASSLDVIYTNYPRKKYVAEVINPGLSDHFGQVITIDINKAICRQIFEIKRNIPLSGLIGLKRALSQTDWGSLSSPFLSSEQSLALFMTVLQGFIGAFTVERRVRIMPDYPVHWYTRELHAMRDTLQALYIVGNVTGEVGDLMTYRAYKNHYKRCIQEAKRTAYTKYIATAENTQKACWRVINSGRSSCRSRISPAIDSNSFNDHFINIVNTIVQNMSSLNPVGTCGEIPVNSRSLFLDPVSPPELRVVIMHLKNKSCLDCYAMNARLLKFVCDEIIFPLSVVFNKCFLEGSFPEQLKVSRIVPVHKKGRVDEVGNYRPIAITPILGKIFELVLKDRLLQFFGKCSIIDPRQYGFRSGHSTVGAVCKLIEDVVDGFDRGERTVVTLCDLSRAFDCVLPSILTDKLDAYGVRGTPHRLIQSYLTNRKQYVEMSGERSKVLSQPYGVPQGSVIGPLLFLIYINDLPNFVDEASTLLFADDTTLYVSDKTANMANMKMDVAMRQASAWFEANSLQLNQAKTQSIVLTTDRSAPRQDSVCLLGIKLDQHLTWSKHVDQVCSRVASGLFALRRLVPLVPEGVARVIYYSLVHSHLTYGVLLWGASADSHRAFVLQKKAVRMMAGCGWRDHCAPWFRYYGILTLPSLFVYETCIRVHQMASSLPTRGDVHHYNTRGKDYLDVPFSRTRTAEKNKLDLRVYNKLPDHLKRMNLISFKLALKKLLVEHCFYKIDDFLGVNI